MYPDGDTLRVRRTSPRCALHNPAIVAPVVLALRGSVSVTDCRPALPPADQAAAGGQPLHDIRERVVWVAHCGAAAMAGSERTAQSC